jgi:hypothetical protein
LERRWRGAASSVVIYADREWDTMDSREDLSHSLEKICPSPSLNIRKIIVLRWNSQIFFLKKSKDNKRITESMLFFPDLYYLLLMLIHILHLSK